MVIKPAQPTNKNDTGIVDSFPMPSFNDIKMTFLSKEEIFGSGLLKRGRLDWFKHNGFYLCPSTAFADRLSKLSISRHIDHESDVYWTRSTDDEGKKFVIIALEDGKKNYAYTSTIYTDVRIRPVLKFSPEYFDKIMKENQFIDGVNIDIAIFGEYPQQRADETGYLYDLYLHGKLSLTDENKTGKTYTISTEDKNSKLDEYIYNDKRFVVIPNELGHLVFYSVSPILWTIDRKNRLFISQKCLLSGITFCNSCTYNGNFEETEMYKFLNEHMLKEILPQKQNREIEKSINSIIPDISNDFVEDFVKKIQTTGDLSDEELSSLMNAFNQVKDELSEKKGRKR